MLKKGKKKGKKKKKKKKAAVAKATKLPFKNYLTFWVAAARIGER